MNKRLFYLILIFLFFVINTVVGQKTIQCRVVAAGSGSSLPSATITFPDSTHAITDRDGLFSYRLRSGEESAVFHISYMGFRDLDTLLVHTGEIHFLPMKMETVTTAAAIIRAHRIMTSDKARPQRVIQLDARAIETIPANDIQGLLNAIPGVTVDNDLGIYETKTTIMLHGMGGGEQGRTLVLRDGIPLNKADGGTVNWNSITKDNLSQAEVIKGASSAIYGANAMGGVIKLTTAVPTEKLFARGALEMGSYFTRGLSVAAGGKSESADNKPMVWWKGNARYRASKGYVNTPEEFLEYGEDTLVVPSGLVQYAASMQGGVEKGSHKLKLELAVSDNTHGNGWQVYEDQGGFSRYRIVQSDITYTSKWRNIETTLLSYVTYEHYKKQNEYVSDGEYKLYDVEAPRLDMGAKVEFITALQGRHNLQWGADFRHGSINARDIYYTSTDIISNYGKNFLGGIFIADEWSVVKQQLTLSMGLRGTWAGFYDGGYNVEMPSYHIHYLLHYADTQITSTQWMAITPSMALNYRSKSGNARVYLTWGEGFRPPVLDDMCRATNENYMFRIPNPQLRPETVDNLETGADLTLFSNTNLSVSVYRTYGRDFMYNVCTGDSVDQGYRIIPVARVENIGKVIINGAEVTLEQQLGSQFVVMAHGAFSEGKIISYNAEYITTTYNLQGKYLTGIPRWQGGTTIMWNSRFLETGITWKYTGKRWINDANIVDQQYLMSTHYPAYHTFDLRIAHRFHEHWRISIDAQNILNHTYINRKGLRSPGRFIMVTLKYVL